MPINIGNAIHLENGESHPKASEVRSIMRDLIASSGGSIEAAAAMSVDGIIIGSALGEMVDADIFAAMNASLLLLAERVTQEVEIGALRQVMVMGTQGVMLLTQVGEEAVLALSTVPSANLGKVLLDANKTVVKLQNLLGD